MTFKEVAVKNFKTHIKKYFMCFLCSTFSIMILFMYSTILFNDRLIISGMNSDATDLLIYIAMISIIIFSTFFINYANNAFLKSRYKEFGVMMTLGMSKKDITKLIFIENIIIIISSLTIGIITGTLFSRLFQMVVMDIMGLKDIEYSLDYRSFLLTISVFLVIFIIQLIITSINTKKFTIEELIKKERVNEGKLKAKVLPGIIGIIVTIGAMVTLVYVGNHEDLRSNMFLSIGTIAVIFIGVYILISSLGMTLLALMKSIPNVYNRNIIEVNSLNKKFTSQKRVIFILTMLATLTIFAIAPPLSLLNETATVVDLNKNDLEIAEVYGLNQVDENKIEEIANKHSIEIKNKDSFEFLVLNFETEKTSIDYTSKKPVLSESQHNLVSERKISVNEGECVKIVTSWLPDGDGIEEGENIYLNANNRKMTFVNKQNFSDKWICNDSVMPTRSAIVINDNDYKKLKEAVEPEAIGRCYQWQLSEWRNKYEFTEEVKSSLVNNPTKNSEEYVAMSNDFLFMAKPFLYDGMKQGYKFFVFITTIMGILFYMSSVAVLFFNQYIEFDKSKEQFNKLYKIGVLKREVNKMISKELLVTFFTPVFIGGMLAAVLMNFTAKVMGGEDMISQFMSSAYKLIGVYFVFQVLFYLFTRESCVRKMKV